MTGASAVPNKFLHLLFGRAALAFVVFCPIWPSLSRILSTILAGVALLGTGCNALDLSRFGFPQLDAPPLAATSSSSGSQQRPFELEILEEVRDESSLAVRGRVRANVDWDLGQAAVRLHAQSESGKLTESIKPLSELGSAPRLARGEARDFTLTIPVSGIMDYQVEVLWGEEAKAYLAPRTTPEDHRGGQFVALQNLEVEREIPPDCGFEPCPVKYVVTGELRNNGKRVVTRLTLAAGFVSKGGEELALSNAIPENERKIEIKNLKLGPGKKQPIKLTLEGPADDIGERATMRPTLRVLRFETAR